MNSNPLEAKSYDLKNDPHRWVVFGVACLVYFFVYFHRVSTSVIVSDLLEAFQTNATALGFMSSMYFYLYAFEQPLVGHLSDRLGPRKVIGWWTIAAAAGCFLFGLAPNVAWASVGRALIGLGVGGVYVPAIKAFSLWFKEKEFATMVGFLMSVGNLGAVVATTPLAWAAGSWGWRPTFFAIGGITLALALVALFLTRDYAPANPSHSKAAKRYGGDPVSRPSAYQVLASKGFWISAAIFFGIYGTLVTLQGLWATPYLMAVLGIERMTASELNMVIPIGVIVGAPSIAWLTDRFLLPKAKSLFVVLTVYTLSWVAMIFFCTQLKTIGLAVTFMVMGMATGGFITILWGIIRETTPSEILGLTSGMLNPAPFLGVAAFQVLTGAILDRAGRIDGLYSLSGFKSAFSACLVCIVLCSVLSLFLQRRPV